MNEPALFGSDLFGDSIKPHLDGELSLRYVFPPLSVLDSRQGVWQDRKRAWISLGIEGEIARAGVHHYGERLVIRRGGHGFAGASGETGTQTPGSIFDPVLCELIYRWMAPPNGAIVDPFAGGSVRGLVASHLGHCYWGSDLSVRQIASNEEQAERLGTHPQPTWVCGDSLETLEDAPEADLIFTCPPYGDLERYSDDPRDISTMEYHTFLAAYRRILLRAAKRLRDDRFAVVVVGDFRDSRRGFLRGFVADTIASFRDFGMELYNDLVFLTPVGSAAMRVAGTFDTTRKIPKVHQNVLVFSKGEAGRHIAKAAA